MSSLFLSNITSLQVSVTESYLQSSYYQLLWVKVECSTAKFLSDNFMGKVQLSEKPSKSTIVDLIVNTLNKHAFANCVVDNNKSTLDNWNQTFSAQ